MSFGYVFGSMELNHPRMRLQDANYVGPSLLACLSKFAGFFHDRVLTIFSGIVKHLSLRFSFHSRSSDVLFWRVSWDQTQKYSSEMSTSDTPGPWGSYRIGRELLPLDYSQTAAPRTGVNLGIQIHW